MATAKLFASCIAAFILTNEYGAALPAAYHGGVLSGNLYPISGNVPVSVHRTRQTISDCLNKYGSRDLSEDGLLKHIFSGTKDIVIAVIKDVQYIGDELLQDFLLLPNVVDGVTEAVVYTLCGVDVAFSDAATDLHERTDTITSAIIDLLEQKGPEPLLNVPRALFNAAELIGKIGKDIIRDIVYGVVAGVTDLKGKVKSGVGDLMEEVRSDVKEVVSDVRGVVNAVESEVEIVASEVRGVVNAVESGVETIGGGLRSGVGNILDGVKGGLGEIFHGYVATEVRGVVNAVESGVQSAVNGVESGIETIGSGLRSGIGNILDGVKGGLGAILHGL